MNPLTPSAPVLALFDSLAHRLLPVPVEPGAPLSFYACGITPYSAAHIGHARSFVVFDLMANVMRALGHEVALVRNVTDIDDKIIAEAARTGQDWKSLAHGFAARNRNEMAQLGVVGYEEPHASEHIPDIIALVARLIDRGHAYVSPQTGDVLFEAASFQGAALMDHDPEALLAHAANRVSHEGKRSPLDFVLWKPAKLGEPAWPSPWGEGRPGWHIECSAMVEKRFGDTLAYHGGGTDLRFPHHQAEILQSEAAFDRPLAHRWVHHGSVRDQQGRKMSKSLGNVVLLADALAEADALLPEAGGLVVRVALLTALWTKPLDWSPSLLAQTADHVRTWSQAAGEPQAEAGAPFLATLTQNLNTPQAFSMLHGWARQARMGDERAAGALGFALEALGIPRAVQVRLAEAAKAPTEAPAEMTALLAQRQAFRQAKDWAQADRVRQDLEALGYRIEDTASGATLRAGPR